MKALCASLLSSLMINYHIYIPLLIENMPQYDIKFTKAAEEASKRRPSIELAPTLEKPIYIVTKNMNGRHILELVDYLEKEKIQYQLQQETSTLGFALNQKFFVIVDNRNGEVTLGADFASVLMTIVGYPRLGKNKKNKYFERPEEIVKYFRQFKAAPDTIKMSKSLIKSHEIKQEEPPARPKIEVRSIIKYKTQDEKESVDSHNSLKEACKRECQRLKMIILEDRSNAEYCSICESFFSSEKGRELVEKAENIDEVRKKTLFHTNKVRILYLTSRQNSQELINSIFIGEVIVFSSNRQCRIDEMVNEPKIYAIVYQKEQLYKILYKIGIEMDISHSFLNSKLDQTALADSKNGQFMATNTFNDSKNSPFLLKNQSNIKQKDMNALEPIPKITVKEVSKIQNNISVISENNEPEDLNASVISKSSSCSRKIKRLGKSKLKQNSEIKEDKAPPKTAANQQPERKKTLKTASNEYYQTASKSKKNLTFKENLIEGDKIRKIKSISKVAPEVVVLRAESKSTMTDDDYGFTNNSHNPYFGGSSSIRHNNFYTSRPQFSS